MYSLYVVMAMAALSQAYYYPRDHSAKPTWRSLINRGSHILDSRGDSFTWCPQNQQMSNLSPAVQFQTLNTTDLAIAQNALMEWCDQGNDLQPSDGSNGQVQTSNGVAVQLCNNNDSPMSCTSDQIKAMLNDINCGTNNQPTMGAAWPVAEDNLDQAPYDVEYLPSGNVQACQKPTRG